VGRKRALHADLYSFGLDISSKLKQNITSQSNLTQQAAPLFEALYTLISALLYYEKVKDFE